MNVGLYQSASALSALERWQDVVAQNITSSQAAGYRQRTVNFSTQTAGELNPQAVSRQGGGGDGMPLVFPRVNTGVNFIVGETQATRRELDVSIQSEGFFELQRPDESRVYTRNGEFRMRPDRTLVSASGDVVLSTGEAPIVLLPGGGPININQDGTIFQGATALGKIAVRKFPDNAALTPLSGGYFKAAPGVDPEPVDRPELIQGYLEASNVVPLREMVDLLLISRAYETNQKMITSIDQQMEKTLQALG